MKSVLRTSAVVACLGVTMLGCAPVGNWLTRQSPTEAPQTKPQGQVDAYTPGLGEIMGQLATRHVKLWFAGQGKNWALASYELDEIREGLDDASKYHPTHKNITAPIPVLIKSWMDKPLVDLGEAVKAKDLARFTRSFDALTDGCNACHRGTDFGFNVVIRPEFKPFPNQSFALPD